MASLEVGWKTLYFAAHAHIWLYVCLCLPYVHIMEGITKLLRNHLVLEISGILACMNIIKR